MFPCGRRGGTSGHGHPSRGRGSALGAPGPSPRHLRPCAGGGPAVSRAPRDTATPVGTPFAHAHGLCNTRPAWLPVGTGAGGRDQERIGPGTGTSLFPGCRGSGRAGEQHPPGSGGGPGPGSAGREARELSPACFPLAASTLLRAVLGMRRGRGKRKAAVTEVPRVARRRTEGEEAIQEARRRAAPSVREFKYNKKRVRLVSQGSDLKDDARCILYWMCRDQRVQGANQLVKWAPMGGKSAGPFLR